MLRPPAYLRPCPDTACSGRDSLRLGTGSPVASSPPSPVDTRQALLVPLLVPEPSAARAGDARQGRGAAASLLWALPEAHVDSSGSFSPLSYVGLPEPQPGRPAPPPPPPITRCSIASVQARCFLTSTREGHHPQGRGGAWGSGPGVISSLSGSLGRPFLVGARLPSESRAGGMTGAEQPQQA